MIGIMDCQEWKDKSLSEGYKKFVQDLNKVSEMKRIIYKKSIMLTSYYSIQQL